MLERIPTRWLDLGVACAVGFFTVANAVHDDPANPLVVGPAFIASLALVVRRSRPLLVLVVVGLAHAVALAAGNGDLVAASVVAFFSASEFLPRRTATGAAGAVGTVILAVILLDASERASSSVAVVVFLVGAWVVGDNARVRREREEESARRAVSDERARIARELHDVVTHNVSVMVVQAAAGNDVFDERPDRAREALEAIEDTGRRALGELRHLLGVVGTAEDAPAPGLARIGALVAEVRRAGIAVELTIEGTPNELPAPVDVSAYRVVQESLTNTIKHAHATSASVRVRYGGDAVEVEVADDGIGAATLTAGRGLVGMRERVALLGGELSAGARPGRGFAVRARMPLEPA